MLHDTSQALSVFSIAALHRRKATRKIIEGIRERTLMAKLNINGSIRDVEVDPNTPLLWVIREQVGLTGTKYGCGIAQCGACTVHVDGVAERSCSIPLSAVAGKKITTIEGLAEGAKLHKVQQAWLDHD